MEDRKIKEIEHGARIASHAEDVWGWNTHAGRKRAARRGDFLVRMTKLDGDSTVLELGCGTGVFTRYLAETGARVLALDLSPVLLNQLDRKKHDRVFPVLGDAEALPFAAGTFDAVVGSSVLHHLDVHKTFGELHRVLRTGGRFAFAEPNMMNPQIVVQKNIPFVKRILGDSPDERAFFRWRVASLLKKAGFVEISVFPYDFLHPLVPRPLIGVVEWVGRLLEKTPIIKEIAGSLIISGRKP